MVGGADATAGAAGLGPSPVAVAEITLDPPALPFPFLSECSVADFAFLPLGTVCFVGELGEVGAIRLVEGRVGDMGALGDMGAPGVRDSCARAFFDPCLLRVCGGGS